MRILTAIGIAGDRIIQMQSSTYKLVDPANAVERTRRLEGFLRSKMADFTGLRDPLFIITSKQKNVVRTDIFQYRSANGGLYIPVLPTDTYSTPTDQRNVYQLLSGTQISGVKGPAGIRANLIQAIFNIPDTVLERLQQSKNLVGVGETDNSYDAGESVIAVQDALRDYIQEFAGEDVLPNERGTDAWTLGMVYKGRKYLERLSLLEGSALIAQLGKAPQIELDADI